MTDSPTPGRDPALPGDPDEIPPPGPGDEAHVSEGDLDSAAEFWRRNAPASHRGLIDPGQIDEPQE